MLKICGIVLIKERGMSINMENYIKRESLESLRQGKEEPSAAFMEFTDKKRFFRNYSFAFYEGEDGKYYNPRIRAIAGQKLIHIKAGNKSKVIKVMNLIQSKEEYHKVITMFFIDRDMEFDMDEYNNDNIYVTPCYSIENLYVSEEIIGSILEDEFGFNIDDKDYIKYTALFKNYYETFCNLMTEFNALVLLRKEKGLNCDRVSINHIKTTQLINIDIVSGLSHSNHYKREIDKLKEKLNVTDLDIEEAKLRLLKLGNPSDVFRGKNQLDFLIAFIDQLVRRKNDIFEKIPTSVDINPNQNALGDLSRYAQTPAELENFIKKHCVKKEQVILF